MSGLESEKATARRERLLHWGRFFLSDPSFISGATSSGSKTQSAEIIPIQPFRDAVVLQMEFLAVAGVKDGGFSGSRMLFSGAGRPAGSWLNELRLAIQFLLQFTRVSGVVLQGFVDPFAERQRIGFDLAGIQSQLIQHQVIAELVIDQQSGDNDDRNEHQQRDEGHEKCASMSRLRIFQRKRRWSLLHRRQVK